MSQPQNKNMAMDFAMAIPGIVLIVFGYVGIFIMLFKVPAKEIIGYESSHESNQENITNSSILTPVLSDKTTKISLPVWWLVKSKGIFSKI